MTKELELIIAIIHAIGMMIAAYRQEKDNLYIK